MLNNTKIKQNKILVTGCSGFIGFHVAKTLLDRNFQVCGIDNMNNYYDQRLKRERLKILKKERNFKFFKIDICDTKKINNLFKKSLFSFEYIYIKSSGLSKPLDFAFSNALI